jgi:hypothetical protein
MNAVLFLSLVIILGAALWPKNSYGRWQHHRLRDKQSPPAYETKIFNHEALQKAAVKLKALEASQKAGMQLCDGKMQGDVALIGEFEERWNARITTQAEAA